MKPWIPMNEKQYNRLLTFLRKTPRREKLSAAFVRILPPVFFAVYGIELLLLAASAVQNHFSLSPCLNLVGAVLSPALCLFSSSVLRTLINRERPYETLPITPLIHKDYSWPLLPLEPYRKRLCPRDHRAFPFACSFRRYDYPRLPDGFKPSGRRTSLAGGHPCGRASRLFFRHIGNTSLLIL